jgi:hypothetical protein
MNAKLIEIGLAVVFVFGTPSVVTAQYDFAGWPYAPYGWGCGYQSIYSTDTVPYFSLHPPVYYSHRVARTYGYSPFAYPPGVLTPGSEPPSTAMYGPSDGEESSRQGPQPLRIDNPFVDQPSKPGVTGIQKPAGRRPLVIYPASIARRGPV